MGAQVLSIQAPARTCPLQSSCPQQEGFMVRFQWLEEVGKGPAAPTGVHLQFTRHSSISRTPAFPSRSRGSSRAASSNRLSWVQEGLLLEASQSRRRLLAWQRWRKGLHSRRGYKPEAGWSQSRRPPAHPVASHPNWRPSIPRRRPHHRPHPEGRGRLGPRCAIRPCSPPESSPRARAQK